jgi:hypothetical protein
MSVISPPRSRRKFGSSFIVDITVRLAPVRGDASAAGAVSRVFASERDAAAAAARVRRFLADAAALARDD